MFRQGRLLCKFLIFTSLLSLQCPAVSAEPDPIRIGCILYLTGDLAMQENAFREGIELAQAEIDAAGGVQGRKLELFVEDTHNDPKLGVSVTQKFLSINRVHAALISSYQDAMASGPLYERAKIPAITLWDASPEIDAVGDYVFSIGPWIPSAGEAAAEFMVQQLKLKTVAIVNTEEQWSESVAQYFEKRFVALGGSVLRHMSVAQTATDFRAEIATLKKLKPQGLYVPLTYTIVPFHKQLRAAGWQAPVVSSDIITDEHVGQAPEVFEGVYQTGISDPENQRYQLLQKQYQARFSKPLTLPWFVATGYDAVMRVAQIFAENGVEGTKIRDGLYSLKDYPGACRSYSFNELGSAPDFETMFQIRQGRFQKLSK